ncbi:non-canonical purine NTP pyrophosphatase [Salinarimonas sp.]|uniref:non-canonical purine NTP pyrophosphatase n=1 Tax=Salinarimonas sp. TaxID=2766526 RepID=UPI0032D94458
MSEFAVVTANRRKAAAAIDALCRRGIAARHVHAPLTEIQDDDLGEIARSKAEQAKKLVGGPVLVEDGGLYIRALNGFPGAYTAYVLRTIGVEGLLSLLEREERDRGAVLASRVAYADAEGRISVFADESNVLQVARAASRSDAIEGWSSLWRILVPPGETAPYPEIPEPRRRAFDSYRERCSALSSFAEWYRGS